MGKRSEEGWQLISSYGNKKFLEHEEIRANEGNGFSLARERVLETRKRRYEWRENLGWGRSSRIHIGVDGVPSDKN